MNERKMPIGVLIKRIGCEIERRTNNDLTKQDLTFAQLHVLIYLLHRPDGSAPLKDLERRFRVAQSTAAGIAARLEKKGLVEPVTDESDRRVKRICITQAGKTLCAETRETLDIGEAELVSSLTETEQAQLYALLMKMHRALYEQKGDCACPS